MVSDFDNVSKVQIEKHNHHLVDKINMTGYLSEAAFLQMDRWNAGRQGESMII